MYLAEIHGKLSSDNENKEDILTSNVFSFFKYSDRKSFFLPFLELIKINASLYEAHHAEFIFWPSYSDGTQPDLVIIVGNYYLLVEAKLYSSFSPETISKKHQLIREIEGGAMQAETLGKEFRIVAITADYSKPSSLKGIPEQYWNQVIWLNWHRIALLVNDVLENQSGLSTETRLFGSDLYKLLVRKRLRKFEGTKALFVVGSLLKSEGWLFYEAKTSAYRGSFIGFLEALSDVPALSDRKPKIFYMDKGQNMYWKRLLANEIQPLDTALFFIRSR